MPSMIPVDELRVGARGLAGLRFRDLRAPLVTAGEPDLGGADAVGQRNLAPHEFAPAFERHGAGAAPAHLGRVVVDAVELVVLDLDHQAVARKAKPHGDEAGVFLVGRLDDGVDERARRVGRLVEQTPQGPFGEGEPDEEVGAVDGAGQRDEPEVVDLTGPGVH